MKKIYFLLLTLAITFFANAQDIATNGSFETWTNATNPDDWTFEAGTTLSQDMTTVNDGSSSMRVDVTTASQGNTDFRQSMPVAAGTVYDVSFDVFHTDSFAAARIYGGAYGDYSDENTTGVWQTVTLVYTATTTGNEDFGIRFYDRTGFAGSSVMFVDNFQVVAQSTPSLAITTPADGDILYSQDVDVAFSVQNFNVANGTGDGYIQYSIDSGATIDKFDTTDISLTSLAFGAHTVNMELVDNSGMPLNPTVTSSVNFTISQVQLLPFTESFNYTDGEFLPNQPAWTNYFSGDDVEVEAGSLNYSTLNGFGNSIIFDGSGADPVVDYTPTSSGTVFSSFILQVTTLDAAATDGYFAILRNDGGSYESRLWISPTSATTYSIGISNGGTLTQISAASHNTGDTVFVVFNYDIDNDTVSAWVNPALGGNEPAADITEASGSTGNTFNQFLLRQDSATETPFIQMDELRIGTSWQDVTPSTLSVQEFATADFSMYPNPTSNGLVNITTTSNEVVNVTVFDILGKQVISKTINNKVLNVSNLNAGVYIVKMNQNGATATKKLVVK